MEISQTMAVLGRVEATVVEQLLVEFGQRLSGNGGVMGGFDATEKLLLRVLDPGRAEAIMQEIRGRPAGPSGTSGSCQRDRLASYLKNEYPQTAAVVLTGGRGGARRARAHPTARRVRDRGGDPDAADGGRPDPRSWRTSSDLRAGVHVSNLARSNRRDNHELMAEIFNYFDRSYRSAVLTALEERNK